MKKILLALALSIFPFVGSYAQVELSDGSLDLLKTVSRCNVYIDFSFGELFGLDEEHFCDYNGYWKRDKPVVISNFLNALNEQVSTGVVFGEYKDAPATLYVTILTVGDKGNFNCEVALQDAKKKTLAEIDGPYSEGSEGDNKIDLIKKGAAICGKDLGAFIQATVGK